MTNQSEWRAKLALVCYFALIAGLLMGSIIVGLALLLIRIEYSDLQFPLALLSIPINETIILGVTLLFARYKNISLRKLGLKKPSPKTLATVSIAATFLFLLVLGISVGEEVFLGPDPNGDLLAKLLTPRDSFQLVAMIAFSLILVGPCEELAFRGFIQQGFENSFGKTKGLLVSSALFGLLHGLNSLRSIVPLFAAGLVFGYMWQHASGNTIASALTHGIYNSIGITIAYFASF